MYFKKGQVLIFAISYTSVFSFFSRLVWISRTCCSGNAQGDLSPESWPQMLSVLMYKLCVLAEPEPNVLADIYALHSAKKKEKKTREKIQLFWQLQKSFNSIFTYCRCSLLLLNDGGWDATATCGLILHLLHSSVPLLSYANGKHLCRSWRQREILLLLLLEPEDTLLSRPSSRCARVPWMASAKSTLRKEGAKKEKKRWHHDASKGRKDVQKLEKSCSRTGRELQVKGQTGQNMQNYKILPCLRSNEINNLIDFKVTFSSKTKSCTLL